MKNQQFNQTQMNLHEYGLKMSLDFNSLICEITVNNSMQANLINNIIDGFGHIYLVNQYLLKKIEKLDILLHEGFLNQESEYFESDLTIIKAMLTVSVFKIKSSSSFRVPLYFSQEELELKLAVQLQQLIQLSKTAPSAYACNYKTEIKVLPGVKLDVYQLIFFAMGHTRYHLNQMQRSMNIHKILELKEISKMEFLKQD